ncbi:MULTISPECIES: hypothetical protein [Methanosarcina]|uniref:Uncharacterized protein n=3 Tax=Methanosarcina barkeri TaxID=2208 RepID=A0A0E3QTZ8_METBA|nr:MULTISPECIES: hypothetical protein [Methanosarcina]AKB54023.1 hypothetical protein MSBRM_1025 [Methanosarcina barkeri MS]AKB57902.1 hypothetical protein MSBR2_1386 [Methanosarcina barkeri 227]AKJ38448.1 hypothetical protein MCM1_1398 [Methanosarcina barkeri CM1]OED05781.1 hypothetical protein A9239_12325 [Methanosarcina sp. A14]
MVKFVHLLVLSALIIWLAASGCVGNSTSEIEKTGVNSNAVGAGNAVPTTEMEMELTQADIQEVDSNMEDLEDLLKEASPEEDIEIEEL